MNEPSLLEDFLIATFLTRTTFEALLSAKLGRICRWDKTIADLAVDTTLREASVDVLLEWSARNPARGIIDMSDEALKVIRIQRAMRRMSEKVGDIVVGIVREHMRKAGIPFDGPDVLVPGIRKRVDLCIPSVEDPKVLIEVKFHNSHGTKLKLDADEIEEIKKEVGDAYKGKVRVICVADGAGWYHRANDLSRILKAADEVFQLKDMEALTN